MRPRRRVQTRLQNPPLGADWLTPRLAAHLHDYERKAINCRTRLYGRHLGQFVCQSVPSDVLSLVVDHAEMNGTLEHGIVLYPGLEPGGWPNKDPDELRHPRPWWHWWIRLEDGTIVDVASSQFGQRSPLVIPPGHPLQRFYVPEGDEWLEEAGRYGLKVNPRVYHRSPKRIESLDPSRMRFGDYGPGFYFSETPAEEHVYGRWLHEADVDLDRPLDLEGAPVEEVKRVLRALGVEGHILPGEGPPLLQAMGLAQSAWASGEGYEPLRVIRVLERLGYDGIVVPSKGYVVIFRPAQAKSLTAQRTNPPSLPSLEAQRRIAGELDRVTAQADALLATARRSASLASELRDAHLHQVFGSAQEIHRRLNPIRGLGGMISLQVGGPADFYVQRSGGEGTVGRPFREAFPESKGGARRGPGDPRHHIGVTVLRTDVLDPRFLFYVAEYAWRSGIYRRLCHGTLQLQHLRLKDVSCGLGAVLSGQCPRRNPDEDRRQRHREGAAGDPQARRAALRDQLRSGIVPPAVGPEDADFLVGLAFDRGSFDEFASRALGETALPTERGRYFVMHLPGADLAFRLSGLASVLGIVDGQRVAKKTISVPINYEHPGRGMSGGPLSWHIDPGERAKAEPKIARAAAMVYDYTLRYGRLAPADLRAAIGSKLSPSMANRIGRRHPEISITRALAPVRTKRNPGDEALRRLEREAHQGDFEAAVELEIRAARLRGSCPCECDCHPALWEGHARAEVLRDFEEHGGYRPGMEDLLRGTNPPDDGRYRFVTDCIHSTGGDISRLVDGARKISQRTFRKKLAPGEWQALSARLGYDRHLPLSQDVFVGYFKSVYRGTPAVFMTWSGIEQVFTLDGEQGPSADPGFVNTDLRAKPGSGRGQWGRFEL